MHNDNRLIDIARRDLLKMAAMTGTAGIITALGESLSPTLAAVVALQRRGGGKGKPGGGEAPAAKVDPITNDIAIINTAIQLEQKAINTYVGAEKEKILTNKALLDVAKQFATDHLAHRDALIKAVKDFNGTPAPIKGLGTFPIPQPALKKEVEVIRYALALELIASKIYFGAIKDKLRTPEGKKLALTILPVETQHVGAFRAVLKFVIDKNNKDNKVAPFALFQDEPMPEVPQGFSWDLEKI